MRASSAVAAGAATAGTAATAGRGLVRLLGLVVVTRAGRALLLVAEHLVDRLGRVVLGRAVVGGDLVARLRAALGLRPLGGGLLRVLVAEPARIGRTLLPVAEDDVDRLPVVDLLLRDGQLRLVDR